MKATKVFLIVIVLVLISGSINVHAAITPPEVVAIPYTTEVVDGDEDDVVNLSTALVGAAEIPLISYGLTTLPRISWAHPVTGTMPGDCGPYNRWICDWYGFTSLTATSVSNLGTERYGPSTFGVAWVFTGAYPNMVDGYKREYMNDMTLVDQDLDHLIQISEFGDAVVGAPSLELVGSHYRMAVVIRDDQASFTYYKLVYMHYVGGNTNTSCINVSLGYQCDVIELSSQIPILSPSLAYAAGDVGIAYVLGNVVHYAYPWTGFVPVSRPANCGPGGNTWRCITIDTAITNVQRVELAYGSDSDHAIIVYDMGVSGPGGINRAEYTDGAGNCGEDGVDPTFRWLCNDVDWFIDSIGVTDFAVTYDPNDYPVISWNNKFIGDEAQRLWISYPRTRINQPGGWEKEIVDGNDWSYTGTQNDISINSAGLTFVGYIQPWYQACGDFDCIRDNRDRLKAALQWFETSLPIVMK